MDIRDADVTLRKGYEPKDAIGSMPQLVSRTIRLSSLHCSPDAIAGLSLISTSTSVPTLPQSPVTYTRPNPSRRGFNFGTSGSPKVPAGGGMNSTEVTQPEALFEGHDIRPAELEAEKARLVKVFEGRGTWVFGRESAAGPVHLTSNILSSTPKIFH
ncbi:MAG: hypothetical protein Q9222_000091 [Ikaeria aurantiellina]